MQITAKVKTLDSTNTGAISLIGIYAFYTGCFMLLGIATPVLRLKIYNQSGELLVTAVAIAMLGWLLSGSWSKSVIRSCYYNLAINYSPQVQAAIAIFWLSLLLIFSLDFNQVVTDGLVSGMWAIVATTLIAVALRLGTATQLGKNIFSSPSSGQITVSEHSDQDQVIVSPNALAQQPRQFQGLMSIALSLFAYTILELPEGVGEFAAIALASLGLTSLSTWQVLLSPSQRSIAVSYSGIWGMASSFTINLLQFSRLETIKLKEVDMEWLQLAGNSSVITLPNAVTDDLDRKPKADPDLVNSNSLIRILSEKLSLVEHKVSRDVISAMHILLPQSVSTLAGLVILGLGIILLLILPLPPQLPLQTYMLFTGCCLVSPRAGRLVMNLVAPSTMTPDPCQQILPAWQVGTGLVVIAIFSGSQFQSALSQYQGSNQIESLMILALIWLCCGVGSCILALSKRSPLVTKRF